MTKALVYLRFTMDISEISTGIHTPNVRVITEESPQRVSHASEWLACFTLAQQIQFIKYLGDMELKTRYV